MRLHNKFDKTTLEKKLREENFKRKTLSFYRYVIIDDPAAERDALWLKFSELQALGRIFLAREGINAQLSVPEQHFQTLRDFIDADPKYREVPFKMAVEDEAHSFLKLIVRVKKKIVADGLNDDAFDVTDVGRHLTAQEFNEAMDMPGTKVVDMRNHYEGEVGKFEGAMVPDADTFRDALPLVADLLKENKESKILLYCTGGIRCEKASAYLRHQGFSDVNQLHGGIISYAHEVKTQGLANKFHGKNFVFDSRLGERISDEIISHCHQCGTLSDNHVNCANEECHLLFIQCKNCAEQHHGCCTQACSEKIKLPIELRRILRKGKTKEHANAIYKSRLRPKLKDHL